MKSKFTKLKKIFNCITAFVLALALFTTSFIYNGFYVSASGAYSNTGFYFDISSVYTDELMSDLPYVYIIKAVDDYTTKLGIQNWNADTVTPWMYLRGDYNCAVGSGTLSGPTPYLLVMSDYQLVADNSHAPKHGRRVPLGKRSEGHSCRLRLYVSSDCINWTYCGYDALSGAYVTREFLGYYGYGMGAIYIVPDSVWIMTNAHIRQYNNGTILYGANISDKQLVEGTNMGSALDDNPDTWENANLGFTDADIDESDGLGGLIHNFLLFIRSFLQFPIVIAEKVANKLGLGALFNLVISKLHDIISGVLNIGSTLLDLSAKFIKIPADLFEKLYDYFLFMATLPYAIFTAFWNSDFGQIIKDIADSILMMPFDIVDKLLEGDIFGAFTVPFGHIKDISDNIINIPLKIGEIIISVFQALFIPRDGFFDFLVEDTWKKMPLVESVYSNINYVLDYLEECDGSKSPVVSFPLSKTSLGKYNVKDVTVDFSWFSPYRDFFLSVESAFLVGFFLYRQYFNLKSLINASNSGVSTFLK